MTPEKLSGHEQTDYRAYLSAGVGTKLNGTAETKLSGLPDLVSGSPVAGRRSANGS